MPVETAPSPVIPETEAVNRFVTLSTARILASTYESNALTQERAIDSAKNDELKTHLTEATPDMLSFVKINEQSTTSRKSYWEGSGKPFAQQNKEWNVATWTRLKKITADDAPHKEDAKAALASLEINLDSDTEENGLHTQIETFRKHYLRKNSKIETLIGQIADGCRDSRGIVNLTTLERRVESIKDLLKSYGTDDIPEKVAEYAKAYSLLTQPEPVKAHMAEKVLPFVTTPAPPSPEPEQPTSLPGNALRELKRRGRNLLRPFQRSAAPQEDQTAPSEQTPAEETSEHTNRDDDGAEGNSPRRRDDDEHRHDIHSTRDDGDRSTRGNTGDHDHDPTTLPGQEPGDDDRSTPELEYVPGDSDSDHDHDSGHDGGHDGGAEAADTD